MTANSSAVEARRYAAAEWCMAHSDGEMDGEELARFEAWVAIPENQAALQETVSLWRTLGEAAESPEVIRMRTTSLTSFSEANSQRWTHKFARRWNGGYAAAACVIAVVAGTLAFQQFDRSEPSSTAIAGAPAPKSYRTGVGERRLAILSDGSKLSLDAGTEVQVSMEVSLRKLTLLSGRARFDVAKDDSRPFVVFAADRAVLALGTSFSVELVDHKVRVLLVEGRVSIIDKPSAASGLRADRIASLVRTSTVMAPGEELVTSASGIAPTEHVAPVNVARSLSWETGQVLFDDTDLATAAARINRYSKTRVVLGDAAVGRGKVSGIFTQGDAASFAEAAAALNNLTVVRGEDDLRLVSRGRAEQQ